MGVLMDLDLWMPLQVPAHPAPVTAKKTMLENYVFLLGGAGTRRHGFGYALLTVFQLGITMIAPN